jgi:hypothetical protein
MARFRHVGDEPRQVSILPGGVLRRIDVDEVFEVDDKVADSYASQPALYELLDTQTKRGAKKESD